MAIPMKRSTTGKQANKTTGASKAKAMKAMKAKAVSKIARGRLSKAMVFRGRKEKTVGGLTSNMLMKNKRGKVVSKRKSAHGKKAFVQIEDWVEALTKARRDLRMTGFVAVNG